MSRHAPRHASAARDTLSARLRRLSPHKRRAGFDCGALLQAVLDASTTPLILVDRQGRVSLWNSAAANEPGASLAEGIPLTEAMPCLANDAKQLRLTLEQGVIQTCRRRPRQVAGHLRFTDLSFHPLPSGMHCAALVRIQDVTEQSRLEEALVHSDKALTLYGLTAGMVHEINNPLAGILQNAQVVEQRLSGDTPPNREAAGRLGLGLEQVKIYAENRGVLAMVRAIRESGLRAAKIVASMVNFSQNPAADMAPYDLGELLDRAVELAEHDFNLATGYDFKQIVLARDYDPALPLVRCSASKMGQAFVSLCRHAALAMAAPGDLSRPSRLSLRLSRQGDWAQVEIRDTSPGLDAAASQRFFKPISSVLDIYQPDINLTAARCIVTDIHQGEFLTENEPGRGAAIQLRLPIHGPSHGWVSS